VAKVNFQRDFRIEIEDTSGRCPGRHKSPRQIAGQMDAKGKSPRSRWRQISLRGLLLLVTAACIFCGWFAWRLQLGRRRDRAVEEIIEAGGKVAYASQFYGGVSRLTPYDFKPSLIGNVCIRLFGTDPFQRLVSVRLPTDESFSTISQYKLHDIEIVETWNGDTSVTDAGLIHLRECQRLKVLSLDNSGVTDRGLDNILGCEQLEELWLRNSQVTEQGIKKLVGLKNLFQLDISSTLINDDGLKVVASLPALSSLDLDGDLLTTEGLKNLRAAPHLWSLWLGDQLSAKFDLSVLADLPELEQLTLCGSVITDDRIERLAGNPKLKHIHLQYCTSLTDESLKSLAKIPNFNGLQITRSPFTVQGISDFKAAKPKCGVY
jgi:hypothetical protein